MPLCIDLFCGLGGWSDGFIAEGWDCIGFDIERHDYGRGSYPGQLALGDVLGLWGSQFAKADCIVASPPCQTYSYMAMPWIRAKALAAWYREHELRQVQLNALFNACFRIQREACAASGRHIPMVVENVKGAQPWVGTARAHFGSFYFWGDIGMVGNQIVAGNASFGGFVRAAKHRKQNGRNFHFIEKYGITSPSFHGHAEEESVKVALELSSEGTKQRGSGREWFDTGIAALPSGSNGSKCGGGRFGSGNYQSKMRQHSSKSPRRKAASAEIAKIPFPLASYVARALKPQVLL